MATLYATIRKERNGRISISYRYADRSRGRTIVRLRKNQELFGVPFKVWRKYAGQTVDLSQWEGTGEGMIGGPTRTQVAHFLYCGPLAFLYGFSEAKIQEEIESLERWLEDDRYEFSQEARSKVERLLSAGREFLAKEIGKDQ
ncbi:MAG: hypothetical protein L0229_30965 [Blastocatellia bacterium]|nr:hypothetical protein [Blastocatellia bacterium]